MAFESDKPAPLTTECCRLCSVTISGKHQLGGKMAFVFKVLLVIILSIFFQYSMTHTNGVCRRGHSRSRSRKLWMMSAKRNPMFNHSSLLNVHARAEHMKMGTP